VGTNSMPMTNSPHRQACDQLAKKIKGFTFKSTPVEGQKGQHTWEGWVKTK
jgi:hypothetical protein